MRSSPGAACASRRRPRTAATAATTIAGAAAVRCVSRGPSRRRRHPSDDRTSGFIDAGPLREAGVVTYAFYSGASMAEISAALVKKLRDITGAGMMECKAALTEANGNLEEATTILRK